MKSIKLIFLINRETFYLRVDETRKIYYKDRRWPSEWQFMPKDEGMAKKILFSRNKIPKLVLDWINDANSGKSLEEYKAAKTIEDLVLIIKKDAASKGAIFQMRKDEEVEE